MRRVMVVSKPLCVYCKKPLVAIGSARRGGAPHGDWNERKLHKRCFKKLHPPWSRGRAAGKHKRAGKKRRWK